ncbi:hypothetical protein J7T55_002042 [Diaporthe amygdali]|uniref:uncharacterized protein n=1 Tax=Phomopsis amygdali TaxID=1214568 RepID=UPI0022FE1803|nr:uncharacterized protein J7T55_002042 [Diaporthe amygdali]KAJ0108438.1 hypothetical protein J7T55_002042 [Diaporthe amygdali]
MLSIMMAMLFTLRALEDHHMSLPGAEEYQEACPEGSRRTSTGAFVKLFAATVTTVGVHGHLNSINGSRSWKSELFRAIEVSTNPLAPVFSFSTSLWFGFIDLFKISPGSWETEITFRYRFARLCGCRCNTTLDVERNFPLSAIGPRHLEATPLERDLTWVGRVLVLLILLGQYSQAALLLIRRTLSDTAAAVDYAMLLLVFSGLVALCQSMTISLLNLSWTSEIHIQPCTEPYCSLPECISFKKEQGLPNKAIRAIVFGRDIAPISRTILYHLAGGFAQLSILGHKRDSFWMVLMLLWGGQVSWLSSIFYIVHIDRLKALITGDQELQFMGTMDPTSDQQQSESLPAPVPDDSHDTSDQHSGILVVAIFFIVGMAAIVWLCMNVLFQLYYLVAPCISLYIDIVSETASWKNTDPTKPCPQLWKDNLEDELWWF